jgi:hypothetical protein
MSNDNDDKKYEKCDYCNQKTCIKCHDKLDKNHICSEFLLKQKEDERRLRQEGIQMDCPYCGTWHEKVSGCSRVQCKNEKCMNFFDFATGGPWDKQSEERQRKAANGRGFHTASFVDETALKKAREDFVDGNGQW